MEDLEVALDAVHLMATMEAVSLARACSLNFEELHTILVGAAGNSGMFENQVYMLIQLSLSTNILQFLRLTKGDVDLSLVNDLLLKSVSYKNNNDYV